MRHLAAIALFSLSLTVSPNSVVAQNAAPAKEEEICQSPYVPPRTCAAGLQCINKHPEIAEHPSFCFKKDVTTVAVEGEGCEGATYSKCGPGLLCEAPPKKSVKVCMRPRVPFKPKE